jgi:hypothetical protein
LLPYRAERVHSWLDCRLERALASGMGNDTGGYATCACRHCAGGIEFPVEGVGQEIECPHCGQTTTLYRPVVAAKLKPRCGIAAVVVLLIIIAVLWIIPGTDNHIRQADIAREARNAAGQAIRLLETAADAIKGARTVEQRVSIAEGMAEAAYPIEPDASQAERAAREEKQRALKTELELMVRQNDLAGIQRIKEQQIGEYIAFQGKQRLRELGAIAEAEGRLNRRIIEIDREFFSGGITARQKQESKDALTPEFGRLESRRIGIVLEASEDQEARRKHFEETSQEFKAFLEEQRAAVQAISDAYDAIPHSGHISALLIEIEKLRTIENYYQHNVDLNEEWLKAHQSAATATTVPPSSEPPHTDRFSR